MDSSSMALTAASKQPASRRGRLARTRPLLRSRRRAATALALCALATVGCGADEGVTRSEGQRSGSVEDLPYPRPQIAREKISERAPGFRRATPEEIHAFVSRRYAGQVSAPPTAAELDSVVADSTSPDPDRRRQALSDFREMIYRLPSADARRAAMERLRAAQGTLKRTETSKANGRQP